MREEFRYMAELPGTPVEQTWVRDYLEALSEWEGVVLAASVSRRLPASAADAVNHLLSLRGGSVYLSADNYKGLGKRQLRTTEKHFPDDVLEYIDLCTMGMRFAGDHPGYFVENHYAVCPTEDAMTAYQGRDSPCRKMRAGASGLSWPLPLCPRACGCGCRTIRASARKTAQTVKLP